MPSIRTHFPFAALIENVPVTIGFSARRAIELSLEPHPCGATSLFCTRVSAAPPPGGELYRSVAGRRLRSVRDGPQLAPVRRNT